MPPELTEFVIRMKEYRYYIGRIQIGPAIVLIKLLLTKIDTRFKVGRVHVSRLPFSLLKATKHEVHARKNLTHTSIARLYFHRRFIDQLEKDLKVGKLAPIFRGKVVGLIAAGIVIFLVKVDSILKLHCALDHKVGTVPTDAAVYNNSVDLNNIGVLGYDGLALLSLKDEPAQAALFNMDDRVIKLANRSLYAPCFKPAFIVI
jgi:hypothetical protein